MKQEQIIKQRPANRRFAQWRVKWLIEHSTSHLFLWCITPSAPPPPKTNNYEIRKFGEEEWGGLISPDSYLRELTANLQPFCDVVFNISTPCQKNFLFF
jgi:hypothetical protein